MLVSRNVFHVVSALQSIVCLYTFFGLIRSDSIVSYIFFKVPLNSTEIACSLKLIPKTSLVPQIKPKNIFCSSKHRGGFYKGLKFETSTCPPAHPNSFKLIPLSKKQFYSISDRVNSNTWLVVMIPVAVPMLKSLLPIKLNVNESPS